MTKTATLTPNFILDRLAAFDFHADLFTHENTASHHLRLPFLDQAFAGRLSAALARMPATLSAPAGTGKTALLRRLCRGVPEARAHAHAHDVNATGRSKRDRRREIAVTCGATPTGSSPMRVRRLRPRLHSRRRS
jgi:hypothetical protein